VAVSSPEALTVTVWLRKGGSFALLCCAGLTGRLSRAGRGRARETRKSGASSRSPASPPPPPRPLLLPPSVPPPFPLHSPCVASCRLRARTCPSRTSVPCQRRSLASSCSPAGRDGRSCALLLSSAPAQLLLCTFSAAPRSLPRRAPPVPSNDVPEVAAVSDSPPREDGRTRAAQ
jgi:hypothetical protein